MPQKKLQVFVSSTYKDLVRERQAAVEAILTAGHIPAGMELFAAGDKSQLEVIKTWISQSDVFLLILGGRYGSIEHTTGLSYVEVEYSWAEEQGIPTFAVVIDEGTLKDRIREKGPDDVFETEHPDKMKVFRGRVLKQMSAFWRDETGIKYEILKAMMDFARRDDLLGWEDKKDKAPSRCQRGDPRVQAVCQPGGPNVKERVEEGEHTSWHRRSLHGALVGGQAQPGGRDSGEGSQGEGRAHHRRGELRLARGGGLCAGASAPGHMEGVAGGGGGRLARRADS